MFLLAIASAPLAVHLTERVEIAVRAPHIRVADVASLSGGSGAARDKLGRSVVAILPPGHGGITISRGALADLVRRATGVVAGGGGEGSLRIRLESTAPAAGGKGCWAAADEIAAGSVVTRANVVETACEPRDRAAVLRFDRGGRVLRAITAIPAGTLLGKLLPPGPAEIAAGTVITLTSTSGPITVSRPVVALQPGRERRRMFVRDGDGSVLSVPVHPAREARQ